MKNRALILILIILGAFSCSKNTVLDEQPDESIDFSWYAKRSVSTKADASLFVGGSGTETHLPDGSSFGVFGYFHPQYNGNAGGWKDGVNYNYPNLFYNEGVTIDEDGGTYSYTYENSRYWPKNTLDRISFFAYYPYNPLLAGETPSDDTIVEPFLDTDYEREGLVGFYYTVPTTAAEGVDFMISDLCLDQSKTIWNNDNSKGLTGTDNGKVKFFFHHALSQVRIRPVVVDHSGNEDVSVVVDSVRFVGVPVFGQCYANPDYTSTDSNTGRTPVTANWPTSGLSVVRGGETEATGVTTQACYDSEDNLVPENILLMIPHTFMSGAKIEVYFSVTRTTDASTGEHYTYSGNKLSASLSGQGGITGWEAGKIYTYYVTLNLKKINVTAAVEPWLTAGEDIFLE